jgi:hypothetical protein
VCIFELEILIYKPTLRCELMKGNFVKISLIHWWFLKGKIGLFLPLFRHIRERNPSYYVGGEELFFRIVRR